MESITYPTTSLEAGIDWITATAPRGEVGQELAWFAEEQMDVEARRGDKIESWGFQGYQGFSAGDWRWGWGKEGAIVVVTHQGAHVASRTLANKSTHWSRVDYAVTLTDIDPLYDPADDYWCDWCDDHTGRRAKVKPTYTRTFGGGSTFSLGRRVSERYLRVYDKHQESPNEYPKPSWRWELELKRDASEARRKWCQAELPTELDAMREVGNYLKEFRLWAPWGYHENQSVHQPKVRTRDKDRILKWLETQVAPSAQWVSELVGRDEVLKRLNI